MKTRVILWSAVFDVLCIVIFVAIGRRNHDEGVAASSVLETATPFLIAAVVGWLAARAWRSPISQKTGIIVWLVTLTLGMVLRKFLFDDGTATAFVIVATIFLGATLNIWRLLASRRDFGTTLDHGYR